MLEAGVISCLPPYRRTQDLVLRESEASWVGLVLNKVKEQECGLIIHYLIKLGISLLSCIVRREPRLAQTLQS